MEIGTDKWLLFDDTLFERKRGFATTVHEAVRDPQPVLRSEMPWEQARVWWHNTVFEDDGVIKLYYCAYGEDEHARLCLATSTDGVNFERPSLGLIEYEGSAANNIVFEVRPPSEYHGTVFIDPVAPPEERYKLIFDGNLLGGGRYRGIRGAYSADGIRWTVYPAANIIPWYTDTQNVAFRDERIGRYVAYVRWDEGFTVEDLTVSGQFHHRCVGRTESEDFTGFPVPEKVLDPAPAGTDMEHHRGWMDLYNPIVLHWPGTPNYIMLPSAFYHYGIANKLDVRVATSRDGIDWTLLPDTFVRLGVGGAWDSERIYMAQGMVPAGDETLLYYAGFDLDHSSHHKPYPPRFGAIGRARIRLDGFVSQEAGSDGGEIVTKPFVMPADRLLLNFDGSAGGHVMIEFLDEDGRGIEGYSGEASGPMCGNSVRRVAYLREPSLVDLGALVGRTVRLRITGRNCRLYSLQFIDANALEAGGMRYD